MSALLFLGILNISCSKNAQGSNKKEFSAIAPEPAPIETFITGKILSKTAPLCLFGRDSEMHPVIKLSEGTDLQILQLDGKIDTKTVGLSHENTPLNEKEYFHAVYENLDFWIEKNVLAFNCENAVAIEKAYLYSDPELSRKIESKENPLTFSTFLAVEFTKSQVSPTQSENASFALAEKSLPPSQKIFYYSYEENTVQEAFVSSDSISSRKDDIIVSRIAMKLRETKKAVPRNELFAEAARYKPCKKVLAVLDEQKVEKKSYNYQEVLQSMQKRSYGVNINELLTVDQSKDPFK